MRNHFDKKSTKYAFLMRQRKNVITFCLLLVSSLIFSQNTHTISGTVKEKGAEVIIGATVVVEGTTIGTITDIDGKYVLPNVPEKGILVFSFVGMISKKITLNGQTTIDVELATDNVNLEEVVAVGYGVQKKSNLTGAISQVKADDIQNQSSTMVEQTLQGKTAGVQLISTSSAPGESATVRIRGYSSNYSCDPLYVVDGVKMDADDISNIDPSNIASMEILKDAASAAIYGAEAGNGVILITTKSGTKGKSKISYNFQYSIEELNRVPEVLNAQEFADYLVEAGVTTEDGINEVWDGTTDTDWTDVAFTSGVVAKHNVTAEGGSEKGNYFVSLSYLNNDGPVKGSDDTYKRYSAMVNGDYNIRKWLKVGTNLNIDKYDQRTITEGTEYGSLISSALMFDPMVQNLYNEDELTDYMQAIEDNGYTLLQNSKGQYYGLSQLQGGECVHPMIMRDRYVNKNGGFNLSGNVHADLKPVKGLIITSKLGVKGWYNNIYSFNNDYYANASVYNTSTTVSRYAYNNFYYQWENFANYNLDIDSHSFNVMAGISYSDNCLTNVYGSASEISKDDPLFADLDYASSEATLSIAGSDISTRKYSYFGRLSYHYASKYFFQASVRRDAADSSILPIDNRWGTFPAVSVGWLISNENFFKDISPITYLKLRGSWGQNGSISNLTDNRYAYSSAITSSYFYPYSTDASYTIASYPATLSNDELKWETSEQLDFGFDLRLLNDRLGVNFDYFKKTTKDLIVSDVTLPLETGNTAAPVNAGDVLNKGVEIELSWRDKIGNFTYGIKGNIATLKNKVTYLDETLARIDGEDFHTYGAVTAFEEGLPVWYMRGYKLDYIDEDTGDPVFVDVDGSGSIDEDDKTMIGSAIPDFTYGFTLNAAYKNFDFTLFASGSQGSDIFNLMSYRSDDNRLKELYDERWTEENPTNAKRPRSGCNDRSKYMMSDAMVFNGSYLKIKQMQFGYTLPKQLLDRTFITSLRAYVSLDNYFTISDYPGFDPEASLGSTDAMGLDKGSYPSSRKTVFGLSISF